jgi:hypothetical protein
MQRRGKVESNAPSLVAGSNNAVATSVPTIAAPSPLFSTPLVDSSSSSSSLRAKPRTRDTTLRRLVIIIFILIALFAFLVTSLSSKSNDLWSTAQIAEQELEHYYNHRQLPPKSDSTNSFTKSDTTISKKQHQLDANEAMKRQPSSWVDGEKNLKAKLKELMKRQQEGKDLGVPILTRWLGEDVPAWMSEEGKAREEWEQIRKDRYAAMAQEELQWRASVRQSLDTKLE